MNPACLILWAIALLAISGVPGLFLRPTARLGQRLQVLLAVLGSVVGSAGVLTAAGAGTVPELTLPWSVPGGAFVVALDGLSAVFLLPVFAIAALGSIYGLGYWQQVKHPDNGQKLGFFYGLMAAGMALLVIARNAVLFLMGWEVMALSAYFLVTTEDRDSAVRRAGWVYLVATHTASLCLFAVFGLLRHLNGSFALVPVAAGHGDSALAAVLWLLTLAGFGLKAGLMPLHLWLPGAHALAPSHVSALMSGVLIKMGVYGIVRVSSFFPDPPAWWGSLLIGLGLVSGILGIAFAIGQQDLKRLLAYSSIENVGIILLGVGLALLGRAYGQPAWILLGLGGALLHVWNHCLFKALLFFCAGAVMHASHTRQLDQLGGLSRTMPRTAVCFLIGALAVCGLPPLNGFVSELLLYLGLLQTATVEHNTRATTAAFAVPALAFIGALSLSCFVKAYGIVFLGSPRSEHARHTHEAGPTMIGPMAALALGCVLLGLAPGLTAGLLQQAVTAWAPPASGALPPLADLAPFGWISLAGALLLSLVLLAAALLHRRLRAGGTTSALTWDCGCAAPSPRMQYTSSSLAQMLVALFAWALRPRSHVPHDLGLFPHQARFRSDAPDPVLNHAVNPIFHRAAAALSQLRWLQRGGIHVYLCYMLLILLALLLWS